MRELDKVIGYDGIKSDLYRIIDLINNQNQYKSLGVEMIQGILLDGIPGIGKTLFAQCFIKECGRKTFTVRKDKPNGEFVNYIRQTFLEAANNSPSIVFLDDMDKFANEDDIHPNAEEYVTVQACIDEVKEKDVFVIATTNNINTLPKSLIRNGRFDKVIHLRFPKDEDAKKIIEHYLADKHVAADVDPEEIMRFCRGYSCAELEKVINEAGLYAAYDKQDVITQKYILDSCIRNLYKSSEPEPLNESDMKRRAIHEAGHVIVTEILDPGSVDFATISARSKLDIGGMVMRKPSYSEAFNYHEIELQILLAGKAATEIVLGEIDKGSKIDMRMAFNMTRSILDDMTAYGFDAWCHGEETSSTIYDNLDIGTGVEMARYYHNVKKILIKNRKFLDDISEKLLSEKTISYKIIAQIKNNVERIVSEVA